MNSQKDRKFLHDYISDIIDVLNQRKNYLSDLLKLKELIIKIKKNKKKIIFVGNGGSAATASHASVDFTKNAKIKSINFNEADLITCFSNDYGYENWIKEALNFYAEKGDLLIIFSCSGKSKNLVNAAKYAKKKQIKLATFTGININNPLKKINSSGLNIFVSSKSYNQIEIIHHLFILLTIDLCIGKKNYPAS